MTKWPSHNTVGSSGTWPITVGQRTIKTIKEKEEEIKQENLRLREWTKEDDDEMGNIFDPYYKL